MKKLILTLGILALSTSSFALTKEEFIKKVPENMKAQIKEVGPIGDGLFYVKTENNYFITSQNGDYLIPKGMTTVIRTKDNSNATEFLQKPMMENMQKKIAEMRQKDVEKFKPLFAKAWPELEKISVKEVRGNGSKLMYVFTDPKCPFCKKFDLETVSQLNDVTIYHIMRPLTMLSGHENAAQISADILCAKDPVAALHANFKGQPVPQCTDKKKKAELNKKILDLGNKWGEQLGVMGTPTLVNAQGVRVPGALPADKVKEFLDFK